MITFKLEVSDRMNAFHVSTVPLLILVASFFLVTCMYCFLWASKWYHGYRVKSLSWLLRGCLAGTALVRLNTERTFCAKQKMLVRSVV